MAVALTAGAITALLPAVAAADASGSLSPSPASSPAGVATAATSSGDTTQQRAGDRMKGRAPVKPEVRRSPGTQLASFSEVAFDTPGVGATVGAVSLALVPGLLVHGLGHGLLGEGQAARRLMWWEAAGVGAVLVGGAALVSTGAGRQVSTPSAALVVTGFGLFASSWLADIYGSIGAETGAPVRSPPPIRLEAGYLRVFDPQFEFRNLATFEAELAIGAVRLTPSAAVAIDADNLRLRLEGRTRLWSGDGSGRRFDGSRVDLVVGATHHRYGEEAFSAETIEAAFEGRLDLARIGRRTRGAFGEILVGYGGEVTRFDDPSAAFDVSGLLLTRVGFGLYLGDRHSVARGELQVFYDHRRDTYPGGISPGQGPGSGFLGYFGADLALRLGSRLGLHATWAQGAARVLGLSAVAYFGGEGR